MLASKEPGEIRCSTPNSTSDEAENIICHTQNTTKNLVANILCSALRIVARFEEKNYK